MLRMLAPSGWSRFGGWTVLFGVNSALVYLLIFLVPFQLVQYYKLPQPGFYSFKDSSAPLLAVGWIILFQLYYLAYRLCPPRLTRGVLALLIGFPILFSLILLFMYPIGSNDIFDIIFRGHTAVHLGVNPYTTTPSQFPNDPMMPYLAWKDVSGTYGPIWQLLTNLVTWITGPDLLANLIGYKLLVIVHYWASMPLVYGILRVLHPEHTAKGLLLFAWNPLILFEAATNGHNDFLLVFWVLAAVYLLVRARPALALLALTAAILVKFTPVLLVPLFLLALWRADADKPLRQRVGYAILTLTTMAGLAGLLYLPFGLNVALSLASTASDMTNIFHASTSWMVLHLLQGGVGPVGPVGPEGQPMVRTAMSLLMVAVILWHSFRFWRQQATGLDLIGDLLQRCFDIFFVYLLVATPWFHTWHGVWLVAFAPLIPRYGYAERMVLFFFLAISDYFIWWYRWPIGSTIPDVAETWVYWAIFPLPLLLAAGLWLYWQSGVRSLWLRRGSQEVPQPQRS